MRGVPGSFLPSRSRSGAKTGLSATGLMAFIVTHALIIQAGDAVHRSAQHPTRKQRSCKAVIIYLTFEHGTVLHITGAGNASEHSIRNHEEREVDTRGGVL